MITATRKVAEEDVTEVMLLSEEKKWKRRTTKYVTYHNTMAALTARQSAWPANPVGGGPATGRQKATGGG